MCYTYAVVERKKSIGSQYGILQMKIELLCFLNSLSQCINTAGLSATFSDKLFIFHQGNRIRFKMLANEVGKYKIGFFISACFPATGFFPFTKISFIDILC